MSSRVPFPGMKQLSPKVESHRKFLLTTPNDRRGFLQIGKSALFFSQGHLAAIYDGGAGEILMLTDPGGGVVSRKHVYEFRLIIERTTNNVALAYVGTQLLMARAKFLLMHEVFDGVL